MGDDGITIATTPRSPLQSMLIDLMGYRQFSLEFYKHMQDFEDLYQLIRKKQLGIYRIVAESPADVVLSHDNINALVTSPNIFDRYVVPFYNEVADMLHRRGKIFMVHMDGRLKALRDLIAKSRIDVVEAFTPPPVGDMEVQEARVAWKDKILWMKIPATVAFDSGHDEVRKKTIDVLTAAAPGDNLALGVTEDIGDIKSAGFGEVLEAITDTVMRHGAYPIPKC